MVDPVAFLLEERNTYQRAVLMVEMAVKVVVFMPYQIRTSIHYKMYVTTEYTKQRTVNKAPQILKPVKMVTILLFEYQLEQLSKTTHQKKLLHILRMKVKKKSYV